MNLTVTRYTLRSSWRGLLWYVLGNGLLLLTVQAVAKGKQAAFEASLGAWPTSMLEAFQIDATTFATPVGYISSTMLSLMWPFILVALVGGAAAAVAGMVEDGTIHFDLSLRIGRVSWLLGRFAASLLALVIFLAGTVLALQVLTPAAWWRFGVLGLAFGFMTLGFSYAVAAASNNRTSVLSLVFGAFVLEWLLTTLAGAANWEWIGKFSVYSAYHPEAAVNGGIEWVTIAEWAAFGLAFTAFALWRWRTRDIPA